IKFTSLWLNERTCEVKILNEKELLDSCLRGLITLDQFAQRLLLLDYSNDSVAYYTALVIADRNKIIATSAAQAQKHQEALQKAIQQQLVQAQKQKKRAAEIQLDVVKAKQKADLIMQQSNLK